MPVARRKWAAFAVVAVVTGLLAPSVRAATTLTVQLSAEVPKGFSARMYAPLENGIPTINIHKDDIVNFMGGAAILPVGTGPHEFFSENGGGLDEPIGLIASDPDADLTEPFPSDAPYKFNPLFFEVIACGGTEDDPCTFDGSGPFFNPGDREVFGGNTFVQITAQPGDVLWAVSIYAPSRYTTMKINVVPGGEDATTQAEIDAAYEELHALDVDTAQALDAKLSEATTRHKDKQTGKWVYDAYAGYDTGNIALFAMYPAKLTINEGDTVRWHFNQLEIEFHTATFPFNRALDIGANGFLPVCDADGDAGDGPDTFDVDFETFTCPPGSGQLELDLSRELTAEAGNGRFPGGLENSGLRGMVVPTAPDLPGGGAAWDVKFTKASGAKGYKYLCAVHGSQMSGKVVVKS